MDGSSPATFADEASAALALLPPARLGFLLRARRKEARVGVRRAARGAGIEIGALSDIESGRRPPEVGVLAALLKFYRVPLGEFVLPRRPFVVTNPDATNEEILRGYVDLVRKWRKAGRKQKLNFRRDDVLTLGNVLGTDPDEIERRLMAMTGCSRAEARLLRKWFLAALVATPLAYGMIGGVAPAAAATAPSRNAPTASALASSAAQGPSASTQLQLTLKAGTLSVRGLDFSALQFTPSGANTLSAQLPRFSVIDATGSGDGWQLTVQTSAITDSAGARGSLTATIGQPTASYDEPTSQYPTVAPAGTRIDNGTTLLAKARPGTGMGTFSFPGSTLTAHVPTGGSYSATIVYTVSQNAP